MTINEKKIIELEAENQNLKELVEKLIQEIDRLKHPKNSHNSSIPPSKDQNRPFKTKSLRTSDGKSPGGQKGHEGHALEMTDTPGIIIDHKPSFCLKCGKDLSDSPMEMVMRKQIVDIPRFMPQYAEHTTFKSVCTCGHHNEASFPVNINAPVSYGPNVEAMIAYLHTRQYIPVQRMSEHFTDAYNLPISTGAICDILERFARKATPAYNSIAEDLESATVVGSDETGAKVNGKNGWFWTWQNKLATFIVYSTNRGLDTIKDNFSKGFKNATIVHDCWKSHFETGAVTHQICVAHLLRELTYFQERYLESWPTKFKQLLIDALDLKKTLTVTQYDQPIIQRTQLEKRLNDLLEDKIPEKLEDVCTFQKRMIRYKNFIFPFLYYPDVPPDNNGSERAIRNIKVKQKVSGQFKTATGAQTYAIIRSIADTCIKNGQNILLTFQNIATLPS